MSEEKKSHIIPIMLVTVIVTASLAVAGTLLVIDSMEKDKATDTADSGVTFSMTEYGAYAEYTMTADRDGTVKASDGSSFTVNGESLNEFKFSKGTYKLVFYEGATPTVVE